MWGELKKEWEACKNGEMQSPIDMSHERVRIIRKPEKRHYKLCNATVKNRGHDISVSICLYYGRLYVTLYILNVNFFRTIYKKEIFYAVSYPLFIIYSLFM